MTSSWARAVEAVAPWMKEVRRELHRHPELSFRETETRDRLVGWLNGLGLPPTTYGKFTGVTALLGEGKKGPAVALRADMDALPVEEATGVEFRSERPGVMHACGHDVHMAALLGAARVLVEHPERLKGPVRLIFQPAEEDGVRGGASGMIARGVLTRPGIECVLGQHVEPALPVGTVGTRAGNLLAAADEFRVTVRGYGGHASRPHLGGDAVQASAEIVVGLQTLLARTKDPVEPGLISVGMIRGGEKSNILPPEVKLAGTVRTYDPELRSKLARTIPERIRAIASTLGASAEVEYILGYPAVVNDPAITERVTAGLRSQLGAAKVRTLRDPVLGAEDFSRYLQKVPGTFWFLGAAAPGKPPASLHGPVFLPEDRTLTVGAEALLIATEAVQSGTPAA